MSQPFYIVVSTCVVCKLVGESTPCTRNIRLYIASSCPFFFSFPIHCVRLPAHLHNHILRSLNASSSSITKAFSSSSPQTLESCYNLWDTSCLISVFSQQSQTRKAQSQRVILSYVPARNWSSTRLQRVNSRMWPRVCQKRITYHVCVLRWSIYPSPSIFTSHLKCDWRLYRNTIYTKVCRGGENIYVLACSVLYNLCCRWIQRDNQSRPTSCFDTLLMFILRTKFILIGLPDIWQAIRSVQHSLSRVDR